MRDLLYLSLQYIRHHRVKLLVLTFAITLVAWLPIAIQSIVDQTAAQLLQRAEEYATCRWRARESPGTVSG